MNVLEGQLTFKFRERLYTLPYFTKQPAHTPFVDSHPLRRRWPLELEPASKQPFHYASGCCLLDIVAEGVMVLQNRISGSRVHFRQDISFLAEFLMTRCSLAVASWD